MGCCKKKFKWLKAYRDLLFIGAGAGAGEKNTWSLSKMDRLHNTDQHFFFTFAQSCFFSLQKTLHKLILYYFLKLDPVRIKKAARSVFSLRK